MIRQLLSPSHSYFSFGIICGRLWGSLAVEDHLRSILGIICGTVQHGKMKSILCKKSIKKEKKRIEEEEKKKLSPNRNHSTFGGFVPA